MVTQITPINLIPGTMIPRVNISQYDTGARVLKFQVYNGDSLFTFTNAMTVALVGTKPDGKGFSYTGTIASNMPTFDVTAQMSAVAGKVRAELIVFESGKRCGSGNFVIFVEEGALGDGTDMSESDYAIINDALEAAFDLDHFYTDLQNMVTEAVEDIQVIQGQTVIDPTLTVSGAAADAKATGDMARNFLEALMTETTTEASIASIDDGAGGLPLKQFVGNIQPAQAGSGDPAPDNVRPISGYTGVTVTRTGKNLVSIPNVSSAGITITPNVDGTYKFSGTATGSNFNYNIYAGAPIRGRLKIKISGISISDLGLGGFYAADADGTNIFYRHGDGIFNADNGISRIWLYLSVGATVSGNNVEIMVYPADLDDTYSPYEAWTTYLVTFPTEAGTVYGGTLTVNSDGSGTLTVDRAGFDANTKTWAWGGGMYVYTNLFATALLVGYPTVQSSHFPFRAQSGTADGYCSWGGSPNSNGNLVVRSEAVAPSLADWNTYIQNNTVTFVYPLATPTTYALSSLQVVQMLNGVNNIWTDAAGTLTAEYYASTGLYVEKRVNAQRNMIAGVEDAMTATKNYAVGDLLIVGNTLYKVTAAISSGAALVVGTNVTETTVAEQLLALA